MSQWTYSALCAVHPNWALLLVSSDITIYKYEKSLKFKAMKFEFCNLYFHTYLKNNLSQ
jgi:hypothetical protein